MQFDKVKACLLAVVGVCVFVIFGFFAQHAFAEPLTKASSDAVKDYLRYACGTVLSVPQADYQNLPVSEEVENGTAVFVITNAGHSCKVSLDQEGHFLNVKIE